MHIAAERGLGRQLSGMAHAQGMSYRSGDIRGEGEQFMDILKLPFADESVDVFYCCHVLNALQDDIAAMCEVYRVLRRDGVAILQVPAFYSGATSFETQSDEERIAAFADAAIYRNYADTDYLSRLGSVGFAVSKHANSDVPEIQARRFALKGEFMHVCRKQDATVAR